MSALDFAVDALLDFAVDALLDRAFDDLADAPPDDAALTDAGELAGGRTAERRTSMEVPS